MIDFINSMTASMGIGERVLFGLIFLALGTAGGGVITDILKEDITNGFSEKFKLIIQLYSFVVFFIFIVIVIK